MERRNAEPRRSRMAARLVVTGVLAFASWMPAMADDGKATRPVLVELFTSQGCSSCPPADAVLRDLSTQSDVLPLAFHVDSWDYLGWADPFASAAFTARQRSYAQRRGFSMYTPQVVIDGRSDTVGSNRSGVGAGIAQARDAAKSVAAAISRDGADVNITVGGTLGTATANGATAGNVYLVSFDSSQSTAIKRGENAGRNILYANVVRSMRVIGEWRNAPLKLTEHLRADERGERLALIVQNNAGDVWAVASTPPIARAASAN